MQFILCGCKTNQYESNAIAQDFINSGYRLVNFNEKADVYIVNTCTVTNISDRKSSKILRREKVQNDNGFLVESGCYAQVNSNLLEEIEEIDLVLGNNEKKDIVRYVEQFEADKKQKTTNLNEEKVYLEFGDTTYTEKTRAVIKIQDRM